MKDLKKYQYTPDAIPAAGWSGSVVSTDHFLRIRSRPGFRGKGDSGVKTIKQTNPVAAAAVYFYCRLGFTAFRLTVATICLRTGAKDKWYKSSQTELIDWGQVCLFLVFPFSKETFNSLPEVTNDVESRVNNIWSNCVNFRKLIQASKVVGRFLIAGFAFKLGYVRLVAGE